VIRVEKPGILWHLEADRKIYAIGSRRLSYWLNPQSAFVGFYGMITWAGVPSTKYAPFLWSSYRAVKRRYKGVETEFLEQI
jgi:hypothetical protein